VAIYAIGDIQGCYDSLRRLLDLIRFDPSADRLWFTGDLVNRGPDSAAVVRFVRDLGERAVTVLGNHDLHLLSIWTGQTRMRRKDSLRDLLSAPDADELMHWLRRRPLLHLDNGLGYVLVHAGIYPGWDLAEARKRAAEVEHALSGPDYDAYFANLYGNRPELWDPELRGADRLRFITNAFTRMRYCTADSRLMLDYKGAIDGRPTGYIPWFDVPGRMPPPPGMTVVFGHWSTLGFIHRDDILALDTGCLWGGELTAARLDGPLARHSLPCDAVMEPRPEYD